MWYIAMLAAFAVAAAARGDDAGCLRTSGTAATKCLLRYQGAVERCRGRADAACEEALRADEGPLDALLAAAAAAGAAACEEANATPLGFLSLADIGARTAEACEDWGEDGLALSDVEPLGLAAGTACRRAVATTLQRIGRSAIVAAGPRCTVPAFGGAGCDRATRAARFAVLRRQALRAIAARCGDDVDGPGLVDTALTRARHFALRAYPPNDLGPTAEFGPFPVGITTLALGDPARENVAGTGPRPVMVEVYYPSTAAAVIGRPRDVATVLNVPVVVTPAYRDVALAPGGPRPLVLFSHGNNGLRIQSFFFAAHLASHGYVVVSPDHHGNTFVDTLAGIVDANAAVNRPLDMRFLLDTFLADQAGEVFAGAIDRERIGMSGHSFGGYTTFALAGGASAFGTFTDPRIKAILPQAPAAPFTDAFFAGITIPTLIVGGSIDETTPPATDQQRPFDHLPSGAALVAWANLTNAGHFTFSDFCEVPRTLLGFLGGFEEACEPRHLPWRHAHDLINYLALNFFDATLRGDPAALARLAPEQVGTIEDVVYRTK
jgi:predicted dienelactone hydrolase